MRHSKLIIENVFAGYGQRPIVLDASFEVFPGQITLLVGHNGCGKSTLLKTIVGEITPFGGTISPPDRLDPKSAFSYLPQKDNLFLDLSVLENISLGMNGRFRAVNAARERVLNFVQAKYPDLEDRVDEKCRSLSGGLRQLTALARTTSRPRPFMILDEPTRGLSEQRTREELLRLRDIVIGTGKGALVVEHRISDCFPISDRIVVMRQGVIVLDKFASDIDHVNDIMAYYFL